MGGLISLLIRNYQIVNPPRVPKVTKPIRFGILGAARIAPQALVWPAHSHPEVVVAAVAARSPEKAQRFAKKYEIERVYSGVNGYQELIDDPTIDAVYNPLPNSLHFEWSMKALMAGKHVLLEKPCCSTSEEAKRLFEYAAEKNLVLLEATHYRYHPATCRFKELLDSSGLGEIKHIKTSLAVPSFVVLEKNDIRLDYDLGGGCMLDMGVYLLSITRLITDSDPISIRNAIADPAEEDPRVDIRMNVEVEFPHGVIAELYCDYRMKPTLGFIPPWPSVKATVYLEKGVVELESFPGAHLWHKITIKEHGHPVRVEKAYSFKDLEGKDYWSTYRHMLEAFVDKLRGRNPRTWETSVDAIAKAKWLDEVYLKAGLPARPQSTFRPT